MKLLSILVFFGTLVSCNLFDPDEKYSDSEYREFAHGLWRAESGDIDISSGSGYLVFNWYAFDTAGDSSSVSVTWDNGLACTTTTAGIDGNKIVTKLDNYTCNFKILDAEHITATFSSTDKQYVKHLIKVNDDPFFPCF